VVAGEMLGGLLIGSVPLLLVRLRAALGGGDLGALRLGIGGTAGGQLLEVELDRLGLAVGPFVGGAALPEDRVVLGENGLGGAVLGLEGGDRGEHREQRGGDGDARREAAATRPFHILLLYELVRLERLAAHAARG